MSIRLRLTLLYSAILLVTLVVLGIGLFITVSQVTFNLATSALKTDATAIASTIRPHRDNGTLQINPPGGVEASQAYLQIRDLAGSVEYQSPELQLAHITLPLDPTARVRVLEVGSSTIATVSLGSQRLLLYSLRLLTHDGPGRRDQHGPPGGGVDAQPGQAFPRTPTPIGVLQMARSLHDVDRTLATLQQVLLLGGGIVILVAFGAGWLLSGAALRPIHHITQTAEEIGATQDFGRRLEQSGPLDEIGRLAITFNTMLARLQSAYHTQRRFVADASHELRTPLTSIRGNLGLLQRSPPIAAADRIAVLDDLVSESERLSRLVSDLLTLARTDAGRRLRAERVPLQPLIGDVIRRLAVTHTDRSIGAAGDPDVAAIADPDALIQVLFILLDNALKFTPVDGTVTVESRSVGASATISVRDTGPGIAPEALPAIFERFYQGDSARTGMGAGLGLAIASSLIQALHGSIAVASRVGEGSVFTVTLPQASAPLHPE